MKNPASPAVHAEMLHDASRMSAYFAAIAEVVRPGDVVVDLGTGTGVLALAAAKAGARHVYAIEESEIADVAEDVFAANGVADRVTVVRGRSSKIDLPERANVLVTETLGNDPLDEGLLYFLNDARERLLVPDATLVPWRLRLVMQLVDVPAGRIPSLTEGDIARWRELYGMDLEPLRRRNPGASTHFSDSARFLAAMPRCSEPFWLGEIDLREATIPSIDQTFTVTATRAARGVGLALGYALDLTPNVTLQVGPQGGDTHWSWPVFVTLDPRPVAVGEEVQVGFQRDRSQCTLELL
jgi:hypothetical protein